MEGYFILKEKAEALGLLDFFEIHEEFQKTIIAITEKDIIEKATELAIKNFIFSKQQRIDLATWFYQNYFDSLIEGIFNGFTNQ